MGYLNLGYCFSKMEVRGLFCSVLFCSSKLKLPLVKFILYGMCDVNLLRDSSSHFILNQNDFENSLDGS